MADRRDTHFPEVVASQSGQYRTVDAILLKDVDVVLEAEPLKPCYNVQSTLLPLIEQPRDSE